MSSVAILTCQSNSHPFQERRISLHEPVKVGRSVARARPTCNNGIFDCKVLSRNHAILWYENGKFYLQDTKSSNGTFINNQRLCKGGEESSPREVFSGDHIQFGVNVMENNRRGEQITHGCIIATITLFHPDGREAKIYSDSGSFSSTVAPGITIQSQEIYQLAHYLQEALHREKMLEQKLSTLQQLVDNTQEASQNGWQALIDEDRLLSRLEVLENQLHIYSKNHPEDTLRQEVVTLQGEKLTYETTSKESLRRILEEKLDAVRKLTDLERSLHNTEDECSHLKDMCEKAQEELQQLAEKYQDQLKEVLEVQEKLHEAERNLKDDTEKHEREKEELNAKLQEMIQEESRLSAKVESLQNENDIAVEQLAAMKEKLEALKEPKEDVESVKILDYEEEKVLKDEDKVIKTDDSENEDNKQILGSIETNGEIIDNKQTIENHIGDSDTKVLSTSQKGSSDLEGKLRETQQQIEKYKSLIEESDAKLKESKDKVKQLEKELEMAQLDSKQYITKIASLEEKLKLSDLHMNQMMENTMADLKLQMKESHKQYDGSNSLIKGLQDQVQNLEKELSIYKIPQTEKMEATLVATVASEPLRNHVDVVDGGIKDDDNLKELLEEARGLQKRAEIELKKYKDELDETKTQAQIRGDEANLLKEQLSEVKKEANDKSNMVVDLQDQLRKAESTTKEVKEQILELRDQLVEEQNHTKLRQEEIQALKNDLDQEKSEHSKTKKELDHSKRVQQESQQSAKQSHNEAEQLKNKVRQLQERLDTERKRESLHSRLSFDTSRGSHDSHSHRDLHSPSSHGTHSGLHSPHSGLHSPHSPTPKHRAEFTALKDECSSLRKRIQAIEAEMKMSRKENLQLSAEYNKLQESYKQLEALKEKLENKEQIWQSNLTDSQKETEQTRQEVRPAGDTGPGSVTMVTRGQAGSHTQVQEANQEISVLRGQCDTYTAKIGELKCEITHMAEEYKQLADRSKVISFFSSIPILMLLFAILMAIYPMLADITATSV